MGRVNEDAFLSRSVFVIVLVGDHTRDRERDREEKTA